MKPSPAALQEFELLPQRMSLPIILDNLFTSNSEKFLEIGFGQYRRVSELLRRHKFREFSKIYDYNSNVRCIITTKIDFF